MLHIVVDFAKARLVVVRRIGAYVAAMLAILVVPADVRAQTDAIGQREVQIQQNNFEIERNTLTIQEIESYMREVVIPWRNRIADIDRQIAPVQAQVDRMGHPWNPTAHRNPYIEKQLADLKQERERILNDPTRVEVAPSGVAIRNFTELEADLVNEARVLTELKFKNKTIAESNRRLMAEIQQLRSQVAGASCGAPLSEAQKAVFRQRVGELAKVWSKYQCEGQGSACGIAANETRKWLISFLTSPNSGRWQYAANLGKMEELIQCKHRALMTWRGNDWKSRDRELSRCDTAIQASWCDGWKRR
ncbi:MAG: hypothetical protein KDJ37_13085 [Hyphomicrobiaceae bacterium]|nr:hypothetical protein [Hyphomicrobiaceae bacterium]